MSGKTQAAAAVALTERRAALEEQRAALVTRMDGLEAFQAQFTPWLRQMSCPKEADTEELTEGRRMRLLKRGPPLPPFCRR